MVAKLRQRGQPGTTPQKGMTIYMKPIVTPNLPQSPVRLVAIAESVPEVIAALEREGIEVVRVTPLEGLPTPVAAHSDLQLLHLGNNIILAVKEAGALKAQFTKFGFATQEPFTNIGQEYLEHISLNFLLLHNHCFGMLSKMPLHLKNHCKNAGLQMVHSKQGYARCSVAVVTQNAAITADTTLYKLLITAGVDTLLVDPGDILLPGYDTGFIGGCCGLIAKDKLAFTGNLSQYHCGRQVLGFLEKHQVTPVYLSRGKLLDIGGILPLLEE